MLCATAKKQISTINSRLIIINKKNMKRTIFTITALVFVVFSIFSQIEATTSTGKKVILNPDNTWTFKDTEGLDYDCNCNDYISTQEDKVTGTVMVAAKVIVTISADPEKGCLIIDFMKGGTKTLIISFHAFGASSCVDKENKINILFRDGTKIELSNKSNFNCDNKLSEYLGGLFKKDYELELLRTKEMETIRVWTSKGFVEENLSVSQSKNIKLTIDCLMKYNH